MRRSGISVRATSVIEYSGTAAVESGKYGIRINTIAPAVIANEAKAIGAYFIHYSTDYVFDGNKAGPYLEDDPPCPLNAYGRSKLAGDQSVLASAGNNIILRIGWVYGLEGENFAKTILRRATERDELCSNSAA